MDAEKTPQAPLRKRRVLVAEKDLAIGLDIRAAVEAADWLVLGPFATAWEAQDAVASDTPDFALLDVELADDRSFALAERLQQQGTPFAFVTGRDDLVRDYGFSGCIVIAKPFSHDAISAVLPGCCETD